MADSWQQFYADEKSVGFFARNMGVHAPMFEALVAQAPTSVLEVGVGTGQMSLFLAAIGFDVTGVDCEPRIVEECTRRASRVSGVVYRVGDAFSLSAMIDRDGFDVAFSQGFFEHFSDEDIRVLVEQQLSVARRVVFSVPSNYYPQRDFGDERLLSPDTWMAILDGVGSVEATYYEHQTVGFKHMLLGRYPLIPIVHPMHVLVTVDRLQ